MKHWRFVLLGFSLLAVALLPACGGTSSPPTGSVSGLLISPGTIGGPGGTSNSAGLKIDTGLRNDLHSNEPLEVVPGEVFVTFNAGLAPQSVRALSVGGLELQRVKTLALPNAPLGLYRAGGLTQAQTLALVADLRARPDVASAFPNWILHALKMPNDEFYGLQWHYDAMNLPAAWDVQDGTTQAVPVAVVDTGITQHPDLKSKLLPGYDFVSNTARSGDGDGPDADPTDEGGESDYHGSHVAGTVAAATDNGAGVAGVSWGAQIVPVRVLGNDGSGSFDDIFSGILWAAGGDIEGAPTNPNPVRVINLSLGVDIEQPCPSEIVSFFQQLADAGVAVVVAAGNDGIDAATSFPASCEPVVTVGAVGPLGTRAPYSDYGAAIDVMAPGGDTNYTFTVGGDTYPAGVLSTVFSDDANAYDYAFYQGTSMASPHVAGLVALMLAQEPNLSVADIVTRLKASAAPLDAGACERPSGADCGAGLVDAAKALGGGAGGGRPAPGPPQTGNLSTYVVAFYCATSSCNLYDTDRSQVFELSQTSNETPFTLTDLEEGNYAIAAFQDLNNNVDLDEGEPFGFYEDIIPVTAGRNIGGVTIYLEPFTPSAQSLEMMKLLPELEPTHIIPDHPGPAPSNSKSVEERVN